MSGISKLSKRCQKCSHVNECDEKRMEACAFFAATPKIQEPKTHATSIYLEKIKKQIEQDFYKALECPFLGASLSFVGGK